MKTFKINTFMSALICSLMVAFFSVSFVDSAEAARKAGGYKATKSYFRKPPPPRPKPKPPKQTKQERKHQPKQLAMVQPSSRTPVTPPRGASVNPPKQAGLKPPKGSDFKKNPVAGKPPKGGDKKGLAQMQAPKKTGQVNLQKLPQTQADRAAAKRRAADLNNQQKQKAQQKINDKRSKNAAFVQHVGKKKYSDTRSIDSTRNDWYAKNRRSGGDTVIINRTYVRDTGYSADFLDVMLASAAINSLFWHNNPSVYDQMHRQAMLNNDAQLLAELREVKAEMNQLKSQGVARQEGYLPPGVPAEVAFSKEMLTGKPQATFLQISTGTDNGGYDTACSGKKTVGFSGYKSNANDYGLDVGCLESTGGVQSAKRFMAGQVGGMYFQSDTKHYYESLRNKFENLPNYDFGKNEVTMYSEPMWLLVSRNSNIDGFDDLDSNSKIYAPGAATKSYMTMASFAKDDTFMWMGGNSNYSKAKVIPQDNYDIAAKSVIGKKNAAMFVVMSADAQKLREIDQKYGDKLRLVPVNDNRFVDMVNKDGYSIYRECKVPEGTLPKLQTGGFWNSQSAVPTLCVDALFVLSPEWVKANGEARAQAAMMAAMDTKDTITLLSN